MSNTNSSKPCELIFEIVNEGLAVCQALHIQKMNGWTRFITMQHNYNLIACEEENEMIPLCADEGVQTIIYSPLFRGRLARAWGETTAPISLG